MAIPTSPFAIGSPPNGSGTEERKDPYQRDKERFNENMGLSWNLLITQLKNQSPLDPMKPEAMMRAVQGITLVEQQIKGNEETRALHETMKSIQMLQASNLTGKYVEVKGNSFLVEDHQLDVVMPPKTLSAMIEIIDEKDKVVGQFRCSEKDLTPGLKRIAYDGSGKDGAALPNGKYTYRLHATVEGSETPLKSEPRPLTINQENFTLICNLEKEVPIGEEHPIPYIEVLNQKGQLVHQVLINGRPGRQELPLPPIDRKGAPLPHGRYTFQVRAMDQDHNPIRAKTSILGKVLAVKREDEVPMINVYGKSMPIQNVIGVI